MKLTLKLLFTILVSLIGRPIYAIGEDDPELEVIEVTAQKRIQSIQQIPVSVTAINANELKKLQLVEASSVSSLVPNINVTRSIGGAYNYFIRGVGMDDFNLSSIPAVGLYVDDVAIHNPMLANFSLLDIARVEVLRGPQNTLYGKNTTGGAINFISSSFDAGQQAEHSLSLYTGIDNLYRVTGESHFSFNDKSALSISVLRDKQDGRVSTSHTGNDTQFNNRDKFGLKLRLDGRISNNLTFKSSLYGGRQQQISEVKTLLTASDYNDHIQIDEVDITKVASQLVGPRNDADSLGGYFKLNWKKNGYQFTSISAFEDVSSERMDDWGSQNLISNIYQIITYNSSDTQTYSQEFQLISPFNKTSHWLMGMLFNKESGDILQTAYIDPAGPGRPDDPIDDAGVGPLFDRGAWVDVDTLTYSLYGQFETKVRNDLTFTAGLRLSHQELSPTVHAAGMLMDSDQAPFPLGTYGWYSLGNDDFDIFRDYAGFSVINNFITANGGYPASAKIDERFNEWGGKLSLSYQFDANTLLYSALSRGFKMGAVNSNPSTATFEALLANTVVPETLVTYEAGVKSEWLNRQLRINAALFWNNWQDYQFFLVYNPGNPANLFASLVNLPKARTKGAEIELEGIISDSLFVKAGIGYLDAKVTDGNLNTDNIAEPFREGFQNSVHSGDRLPNTPEWTFNAFLTKFIPMSLGEIELMLHYQFIDEHIHALAGNNSSVWQYNFSEQAVHLINVSAQFTPASFDEATLHLWAKNLTDEKYCSERATIPGTPTDTVRLCAQGTFREMGFGIQIAF